ncbi:MAG: LysR substrate-binding domain-containing protein [Hydrogenophaga sp.]|uniref:LysR substrate-binding domain-containing protein n=1 Tax=Hydrogenophaga sp. TaxID=1904254 RepID=UPI0027217476|nr:LysR substrate-binding domain-containing protein [Hydrogenophaga sp.]MDO9480455.1 LysR substrate-binding domain-containing protein [Hydrogenophaga sp.]MDP3347283.1 LysR substrate-binding domain-containing protein [Hydrogenophaga sp.]MDP3809255.1 LysR substrate-binding domain-containing protein [Hydrogenophaga sp.]MDP3926673.1 LysR substrate-binding domain-containing protein [Hydrogenophaga sp.]MDZ4237127.1 LysR substrate-binding domain-containing protein [Hydrogenophaga sp.]
MQLTSSHPRTRPISAGHLRAFEAVARHLNFRAAGEELSLTQSAVSRQIQALEDEVGTALFLRHTRAVELTSAGAQLLRATGMALERIDAAVRQIRQSAGRKSVAITTWASFASMWLIPRLEAFQREYPDIDIRIDASDAAVDLTTADVDLALRYAVPQAAPPGAIRLFGEQLTPVASPWLLKEHRLAQVEDLARMTLIEAGDAHRTRHLEWLTWQRWLDLFGSPPSTGQRARGTKAAVAHKLTPQRWLYFNYAHQIVQAALSGQGVALARLPLVADSLTSGALVEPLPHARMDSPLVYWLLVAPRNPMRPEVKAFCDWLQQQAAATREAIGEVPDPDTVDHLD